MDYTEKVFSFEKLSTGKNFEHSAFPDFTLHHRLPLPRLRPSGPPKEVQFTTIGTISLLHHVPAQYLPFSLTLK